MSEMSFDEADLSRLKYVKIVYTGPDGESQEIKTQAKFIRSDLTSLFLNSSDDFDINYPQDIVVKFVAEDASYEGQATLQKIERGRTLVAFTITSPKTVERCQNRRYYRINLKRECVLVATDSEKHSSAFLARVIDVSGCGILVNKLETMFSSGYVAIDPAKYEQFHIILFLDIDKVLKLPARFVRQDATEGAGKYAFEYTDIKQNDIDLISKYVTKEQIEQINLQKNIR